MSMVSSVKSKSTFKGGHYTTGVGKGSKTRDPKCSSAMSKWKSGGMTSEIAGVLGKCRAQAHALKTGHLFRESGQEIIAKVHEHRAAKGAAGKVVGIGARKAEAQKLRAQRSSGHQESQAFAHRVHGAVAKVGKEGEYKGGVLASHVHKQYEKLHGKIDIKEFKNKMRDSTARGHLSFKPLPDKHKHAPGYVARPTGSTGKPLGAEASPASVAQVKPSKPAYTKKVNKKEVDRIGGRAKKAVDRLEAATAKMHEVISKRPASMKSDGVSGKQKEAIRKANEKTDKIREESFSSNKSTPVDKAKELLANVEAAKQRTEKAAPKKTATGEKVKPKSGFKVLHEHITKEQEAGRIPKGNQAHSDAEQSIAKHAENLASTRGHKVGGREYQEAIDSHINKLKGNQEAPKPEPSKVTLKSPESASEPRKKTFLERIEENARNARAAAGMTPKESAAFHRSEKGTHKERLEYVQRLISGRRPRTPAEHADAAVAKREANASSREQEPEFFGGKKSNADAYHEQKHQESQAAKAQAQKNAPAARALANEKVHEEREASAKASEQEHPLNPHKLKMGDFVTIHHPGDVPKTHQVQSFDAHGVPRLAKGAWSSPNITEQENQHITHINHKPIGTQKESQGKEVNPEHREAFFDMARKKGQLSESQYRQGGDPTEGHRYSLERKAFARLGEGHDREAVIRDMESDWHSFAKENNAKVEAAAKIKRGSRSGQSTIEHRHADPGRIDSSSVHVRNMHRQITGQDLLPGMTAYPSKSSSPVAVSSSTHEEQIHKAFTDQDKANKGTDFVKIHDVRARVPHISRDDFDKAFNEMRKKQHFTADTHEGLTGKISDAERASGIHQKGPSEGITGKPLVYMSRGNKYQDSHSSPVAVSSVGGTGHTKQFAEHVHEAAANVDKHGRFGNNKAFISHVHKEYTKTHGSIPLHEFKSKLMEAHTAGHVRLSRANMVEGMNPRSVGMSRTVHPMGHEGSGEFHMIETKEGPHNVPPKRSTAIGSQLKRIKERVVAMPESSKRTYKRVQQAQGIAQGMLVGKSGPFSELRMKRLRGGK